MYEVCVKEDGGRVKAVIDALCLWEQAYILLLELLSISISHFRYACAYERLVNAHAHSVESKFNCKFKVHLLTVIRGIV